jgi:hypothetical protein
MSRAVALIEEGYMTTAERRGEVMEDTTEETLDQYRIAIVELRGFIENDAQFFRADRLAHLAFLGMSL